MITKPCGAWNHHMTVQWISNITCDDLTAMIPGTVNQQYYLWRPHSYDPKYSGAAILPVTTSQLWSQVQWISNITCDDLTAMIPGTVDQQYYLWRPHSYDPKYSGLAILPATTSQLWSQVQWTSNITCDDLTAMIPSTVDQQYYLWRPHSHDPKYSGSAILPVTTS